MYILVSYRKQDIEKLHDVHQGLNALKCIIKNVVWWPWLDNDIEENAKNGTDCKKQRLRLKVSTDEWKEYELWEKLHMDWLCEQVSGNFHVVADSGFG